MSETTEFRITYICSACGATDCKLWRDYQSFSPRLLCVICAGIDQDKDTSSVDDKGLMDSGYDDFRQDQIGWLVPAVPTSDWKTYWGYTSVPDEGVTWWRYLPSKPPKKESHDDG